uniref:Uncharacterized protein n=1 Tax=Caenorhabditis japonica TaxID=281687 RepID=A0A8R1EDG3_CAEJA
MNKRAALVQGHPTNAYNKGCSSGPGSVCSNRNRWVDEIVLRVWRETRPNRTTLASPIADQSIRNPPPPPVAAARRDATRPDPTRVNASPKHSIIMLRLVKLGVD